MYQYSNSLIRQFPSQVTGNAAVGVQATVYVGETNTLASLFEVNGSARSNPVTTDDKGFYYFSLTDGDYRIVFSSSQFATLRISVLDGALLRQDFNELVASNTAFRNEQQAAYDSFVLSQGWDQVGTFAAGFTYTSPNQVGQDIDGNWWRWNGALPKVVTAGTLPSSDANYKLVGDGVLRSDLADGTANIGGITSEDVAASASGVDGIKNLLVSEGIVQSTSGFYVGEIGGVNQYYYDPLAPKSLHDVGRYLDPLRIDAWDGTHADLDTLYEKSVSGNGCFVSIDPNIRASSFGALSTGDSTVALQAFFDAAQYRKEIELDTDANVDTAKNTVVNTDPRPPISDGETSSAAIVINYPVKCHSLHKITALAGTTVTTYHFLFSTASEDVDLSFEIDGNRTNAPSSSLGIQVNNDNVTTLMWGGSFGSSPLVLNGNTRADPLLGQQHNGHQYTDVGNSIFCRFVKDGNANDWVVSNVSEGVDLDKTCDGMHLDGWTVRTTRGSGADAAIEFNGAKNCTADNLIAVDFKTAVLFNAKERYDEPGVYDSCENCHADNASIVNPSELAISYGNVIGNHTDAINCSTDNATIIGASATFDAIIISGTNVSARNAKIRGGGRNGILARGGTVDVSGSEISSMARAGIDTLSGVILNARNVVLRNNNTAGTYNGLNIVSGADVDCVGAKITGAHQHAIQAAGTASITYGSLELSGSVAGDFRLASTVTRNKIGSAGKGSIYNATVLNLGSNRREYYGSKSDAPTSSWVFSVGDVIWHTDATAIGEYMGRVCYDAGPAPLFRNFGKIE